MLQVHHEKECPAYPVVCDKCNEDGIPRAKVQLVYMFFFQPVQLNSDVIFMIRS